MKREVFYVGLVNGKIHLFRDQEYYDGVRRADLFTSKREAAKCYEEVACVTVERLPKRRAGAK